MNKQALTKLISTLGTSLLVALCAVPAKADSTWNLSGSGCTNADKNVPADQGFTTGNIKCTNTGVTAQIGGWADTGTSGKFVQTKMYNWGGSFGIVSGSESSGTTGPHATDNYGNLEGFLIQLSSTMSLSQLQIGWDGDDNPTGGTPNYNDSDISLYRWDGGAAPTFGNETAGTLNTNSWKLVNHYKDVGNNPVGAGTDTLNLSGTGSSTWWFVSAYNSNVKSGATALDSSVDAFKLISVSGKTPGVPEPGTLALAGLALIGIVSSRRRAAR